MIEYDLRFLMAVLNWACVSRDHGHPFLTRNPLRGLKPPVEKNPRRVVMAAEEYEAMLSVAHEVDWRFHVALVLAHETGHRIGAIRQLRWSDVDLASEGLRWRAETEKNGFEHRTPLTSGARAALEVARCKSPGVGEAPVLPSPTDAGRPINRHLTRDSWKRAEKAAGLEPKRGRGWHSQRRKFASDLLHQPLKVLSQLGGWKTERAVLICYQHPDEPQLREALADRRRVAQ